MLSALYKDWVRIAMHTLSTTVKKNQSVNDVYNKVNCMFWDPYKTSKQREYRVEFFNVKPGGT
jgi:hypothetical protein